MCATRAIRVSHNENTNHFIACDFLLATQNWQP